MKKNILIIGTLIIFLCSISINVYAISAGTIFSDGDGFISAGELSNKIDPSKYKDVSSTIYNILLIVGIVIAVAVGIILGIKFITGGVEGQADVKKTLIPYTVGCIVIFGAFGIWKLVVDILQST